jgi:hypothetical protein
MRVRLHLFAKLFLMEKPQVPRLLIRFVDGVIGVPRHLIGIVLKRPPEVRHEAIFVIDRLGFRRGLATEKNRSAPEEGFDVIRYVPEAIPN